MTFVDSSNSIFIANINDFCDKEIVHYLSNDERVRMQRFQFQEDRKRYLVAHTVKRFILSRILKTSSEGLCFNTNSHGKPFCLHSDAPNFNLSHSRSWVALIVSAHVEVGVDLEFPREKAQKYQLLQRFCSDKEISKVKDGEVSDETFLCFWTQKEALSKMLGVGLSAKLKTFICSGGEGESIVEANDQLYHLNTMRFSVNGILTTASEHHQRCNIYRLARDITELGGLSANMLKSVENIE